MNVSVRISIQVDDYTYTAALYFAAFAFGLYHYPIPVRSTAFWLGPFCFSKSAAITSTGEAATQ